MQTFLWNKTKKLCLVLPPAADSQALFRDIRISFVNMDEPLNPWEESKNVVFITGAGLRAASAVDIKKLELLEVLDALVTEGAGIFRGVLDERPDLLEVLSAGSQTGALKLLLWAWQRGMAEDCRLAARRPALFEALRQLHSMPAPESLSPRYTGLLHALWLIEPDLRAISPASQSGQEKLADWYDEHGRGRYNLAALEAGPDDLGLRDQPKAVKDRLELQNKSQYFKKCPRKRDASYDNLNKIAGFLPLAPFSGPDPVLALPTSQLVTRSQFQEGVYYQRCAEMGLVWELHRKQWEWVYILQALVSTGILTPRAKGLGFGVGKEPLPSVFAARGCRVTGTDYTSETGWNATNQQCLDLKDIWKPELVSWEIFEELIEYEPMDMNRIPGSCYGQYDFCWSACAFEHLGSIRKGLDFVRNSVKCLRSGGVAVHTTELNISSLEDTMEARDSVFFRKGDLLELLDDSEFEVLPFNWSTGNQREDFLVDFRPYVGAPHLKLSMGGYINTSVGIIIRKF